MPPHTAVVCAAHTDLGKHVVRNLLRSAHIIRVYALSELDVRDALSNESSSSLRKLHLLTQPIDHMERTLASSSTSSPLRHADLAFYCLCTPRHAVPSLGPYLYHKLNYDLPLRFLTEMLAMPKMHSVSLLAHPCASSTRVRSQFLRVKAQLVEAARELQQNELKNSVCRIVFHLVPTLLSQGKPPYFDHVADHAFNGVLPRPLSKLDRIRQKAVMKHDPDAARPLLARDVAAAMVADALDSVISVSQINMITPDEQQRQQKQTSDASTYPRKDHDNKNKNNPASSTEKEADLLRMQTNLFVLLQPDAIVDLARTARALRRHGGYGATAVVAPSSSAALTKRRLLTSAAVTETTTTTTAAAAAMYGASNNKNGAAANNRTSITADANTNRQMPSSGRRSFSGTETGTDDVPPLSLRQRSSSMQQPRWRLQQSQSQNQYQQQHSGETLGIDDDHPATTSMRRSQSARVYRAGQHRSAHHDNDDNDDDDDEEEENYKDQHRNERDVPHTPRRSRTAVTPRQQQQQYNHMSRQQQQHKYDQQQQRAMTTTVVANQSRRHHQQQSFYNNNKRSGLHSAQVLGERLARPSDTFVRGNQRLPDADQSPVGDTHRHGIGYGAVRNGHRYRDRWYDEGDRNGGGSGGEVDDVDYDDDGQGNIDQLHRTRSSNGHGRGHVSRSRTASGSGSGFAGGDSRNGIVTPPQQSPPPPPPPRRTPPSRTDMFPSSSLRSSGTPSRTEVYDNGNGGDDVGGDDGGGNVTAIAHGRMRRSRSGSGSGVAAAAASTSRGMSSGEGGGGSGGGRKDNRERQRGRGRGNHERYVGGAADVDNDNDNGQWDDIVDENEAVAMMQVRSISARQDKGVYSASPQRANGDGAAAYGNSDRDMFRMAKSSRRHSEREHYYYVPRDNIDRDRDGTMRMDRNRDRRGSESRRRRAPPPRRMTEPYGNGDGYGGVVHDEQQQEEEPLQLQMDRRKRRSSAARRRRTDADADAELGGGLTVTAAADVDAGQRKRPGGLLATIAGKMLLRGRGDRSAAAAAAPAASSGQGMDGSADRERRGRASGRIGGGHNYDYDGGYVDEDYEDQDEDEEEEEMRRRRQWVRTATQYDVRHGPRGGDGRRSSRTGGGGGGGGWQTRF